MYRFKSTVWILEPTIWMESMELTSTTRRNCSRFITLSKFMSKIHNKPLSSSPKIIILNNSMSSRSLIISILMVNKFRKSKNLIKKLKTYLLDMVVNEEHNKKRTVYKWAGWQMKKVSRAIGHLNSKTHDKYKPQESPSPNKAKQPHRPNTNESKINMKAQSHKYNPLPTLFLPAHHL